MRIYGITSNSQNAGPSPHNNTRMEVFLAGCEKAASGNPCKGCFNVDLWRKESAGFGDENVQKVYDYIVNSTNYKYVTFVGGEPMDQAEELLQLCNMLKKVGFNILIITHHKVEDIDDRYIPMADIWIDGEYEEKCRIFDDSIKDNIHNVIGSGNQRIWINHNEWLRSKRKDAVGIEADRVTQFEMQNDNGTTTILLS